MGLTPELEALIAELEKVDAEGAKEQRAILEKHPTLQTKVQEGVLRQSDYDRKMNDSKKDIEYGKTMKTWADKNVPIYTETLKRIEEVTAEKVKLEEELRKQTAIAAAVSSSDGKPVDPEQIAAAVRAKLGTDIPTKTELAALVAEETKKSVATAREEFFTKTFPDASKWQAEMTDAQIQYFQETGKRMDPMEFGKYMLDNKIASPKEGYAKFVEPINRAKEIEAEATKRADKIIEDRKKAAGDGGFPGSSGPPRSPGALEVRIRERSKDDPLFGGNAELGDGSLAAAAAAELSTEGK